MRITFDLPDPAASLLLRLAAHIRTHAKHASGDPGSEPSCDAICRSMVVDLLVDDAIEHGVVPDAAVTVQ
jgi:hypothetical protein